MLNLQEIFVWYFEQKGVDNPERFLGVGVNGDTNPLLNSMLQGVNDGAGVNERVNEGGNVDTNPLLNSMQQVVAGAGVNERVNEGGNVDTNPLLNSMQQVVAGAATPQEKAQPENPTEQTKTDFNAEAISKLIPIFAKYIRNAKKSKQNSFESMLSQVLAK